MKDFKDKARPQTGHQKELVKLIKELSARHSHWRVFSDFAEMAALSISNAMDKAQFAPREERYFEIIKRYTVDELNKFPKMFSYLVLALEEEISDVLGRTFHDLELHNKYAGQYFSPYPVCRIMAKMTLGDDVEQRIARHGFVTALEPTVGSGAMVIALAHEMRDSGINYQRKLHVTATDIDAKCVHMAYLQLSLLHVPAVVIHGNSLSGEEYSRWHTPAHMMGGWDLRLDFRNGIEALERHAARQRGDTRHADTDPPAAGPMQLNLF